MISFRSKTARILVVDDHPVVRRGIIEIINDETDMEAVGEASDAQETLKMIEKAEPDLVITDLSLQGSNGIDLIKQVKLFYPSLKILVMSMHEESIYAERAIRAGALGFINKHMPVETILSAIHCVLSGRIYLSDQQKNNFITSLVRHDYKTESPVESLSNRELDIFERIGKGCSTKEIAGTLKLSIKTVETHRFNIKKKLNIRRGNELVCRAAQWVMERV